MQLDHGTFRCDHCARHFVRPNPYGRKPSYCTRTCRQRAYEARRRLQLRVGVPPVDLVPSGRDRPNRYESGISRGRHHRLRTEGVPDRRRFRPTLCGTYALPLPSTARTSHLHRCRTCEAVIRRHPPTHHHDPSTDVAVLRTLVGRLRHPGEDVGGVVDQLLGYCFTAAAAG